MACACKSLSFGANGASGSLTSLSEREVLGTSRLPATELLPVCMVTVVFAVPAPPAPLHCRVNVVAALIGPVVSEPDGGFTPLQPPDAWQVSALVLDQESVEVPPTTTFVG